MVARSTMLVLLGAYVGLATDPFASTRAGCTCGVPGVLPVIPFGTGPSCKGMKARGLASGNLTHNPIYVYGADDCPSAPCTCPPRYFAYTCGPMKFNPPIDTAPMMNCSATAPLPLTCHWCMKCSEITALQGALQVSGCTAPVAKQCVGNGCSSNMCGIVGGELPVEKEIPASLIKEVVGDGFESKIAAGTYMHPKGLDRKGEKNLGDACKADCTCPCPDARFTKSGPASPCTCPEGFERMTLDPTPGSKCGPTYCSYCVKAGVAPWAYAVVAGVVVLLGVFSYFMCCSGGKSAGIDMDNDVGKSGSDVNFSTTEGAGGTDLPGLGDNDDF